MKTEGCEKDMFYVKGYSIAGLGARKAARESFQSKADFSADWDLISEAAKDRSNKIYYYTRKGRIKALFIIRKAEASFVCNDIWYASDIPVDSRKAMDRRICFEVSEAAYLHKGFNAVFKGGVLPSLYVTKGGFNWSMAISFAVIYGMLFSCMGNHAGWMIGVMLGFAIGAAMEKKKYSYVRTEPAAPAND